MQLLQIAVDLLCPSTRIPSINLHDTSNESQSKHAVRKSGVILLSLTAFISVFGRWLPPTHRGWTTLGIFAGHNLLSSAMIMKCGVDTLALLKASNLVGVSLHIMWLVVAVITAFDSILIRDTENDTTECN